jgi:hypothetical protein
MNDIYIVYRDTFQVDGYVEILGNCLGYNIAKIQKVYIDNRINISKLNPLVIREELALSWNFIDSYDGKVSIKTNTNVADQLADRLSENQITDLSTKGKIKYPLSEKEIKLAVEFHKLILYKIIEDRFSEKYLQLCHYSSALERASWSAQLYEASRPLSEPKPVLELLAKNANISLKEMVDKVNSKIQKYNLSVGTLLAEEQKLKAEVKRCETLAECHRLRHLKFGISMSAKQMEYENVEISPATLKITF